MKGGKGHLREWVRDRMLNIENQCYLQHERHIISSLRLFHVNKELNQIIMKPSKLQIVLNHDELNHNKLASRNQLLQPLRQN